MYTFSKKEPYNKFYKKYGAVLWKMIVKQSIGD